MSQFRPFAIAPTTGFSALGTQTIGRIVVGVDQNDYYNNYADLQWIAGPDETNGIIIAYRDTEMPYHSNSLTPSNLYNIGFLRAADETEFIQLTQSIFGLTNLDANESKAYLNSNGYWTSYGESPWPYGYIETQIGGSWNFYAPEGPFSLDPPVQPPINNGNAIFVIQGSPMMSSLDPNVEPYKIIYFDVFDSNGNDYTAQFNDLAANGGTINITQTGIGQSATYTSNAPGAFMVQPDLGGNPFFMINTNIATQITSTDGPFVYSNPIIITFG